MLEQQHKFTAMVLVILTSTCGLHAAPDLSKDNFQTEAARMVAPYLEKLGDGYHSS